MRPPRADMRPGWSLIELVTVMILLGAFMMLTAELYTSTTMVAARCERDAATAIRFDAIMNDLRRDVWNATSWRVDDERAAVVEAGDGVARWTFEPVGQSLVRRWQQRDGTGRRYQWDAIGGDITFSSTAAGLFVHVGQHDAAPPAPIPMISQLRCGRPPP